MIAVIDSGLANISSVVFALERIQCEVVVTQDPDTIQQADKVILPGVGTAIAAMQNLKKSKLTKVIPQLKQPVLGICLGMQLLYDYSDEGEVDCLGIIPGKISKLSAPDLIIPHMGWNTLTLQSDHDLFNNIPDAAYVYFVHSYCAPISQYTLASTHYGHDFSSIVKKDNFYAMQFHPERSGKIGEQLLENFIRI